MSGFKALIVGIVAVFSFWPIRAESATISVEDLGDGDSLILVTGEIVAGDGQRFRREAAKVSSAIVALESPGGATLEAIEIGETIRIRGFSTLVVNNSQCVSACALIWLAGTPRTLSRSASVGFHATYIDQDGQLIESGVGNALVGRYFAVLNLSQRAIVFATSAKPTEMNWLTVTNAEDSGFAVKVIDDFPAEKSDLPNPPPVRTYRREPDSEVTLWSTVGEWSIITDHTLGDSCFALRAFDDGTSFRLGLDLRYENSSYIMLSNTEWASLEVGSQYPLSLEFDSLGAWEAEMDAVDLNGLTVLYATFEGVDFWQEFSSSQSLSLSRNGRTFARMGLAGSRDAVSAVVDCQRAANKVRAQRDPFAD